MQTRDADILFRPALIGDLRLSNRLEFKDGKVKIYREYFDAKIVANLMGVPE